MSVAKSESVTKALMVNERYQVLILTVGEHKAHPDKSYKPDLPGGIVNPGEAEHEAVIREIYEETGIEVYADNAKLAYAETQFFDKEQKSVTKLLYLVHFDYTPNVKISWEHESYEWIDIKEITDLFDLHPFYKSALEYCIKNNLI